MGIDFGLGLLPGPPRGQISKWVDDLDSALPPLEGHFRSLWMTDHLCWDSKPTYEAWTVMAFVSSRWPKFEIGSMVLSQSYRNPALLAKMAATLQSLSGRLILGIGAGWKEDEYRAYDFRYPKASTRIEQLEETVEIVRRMWTSAGRVTYEGNHYSVHQAYCEPKPDPVPPIMIGGKGKKTLRVAAKLADWWNISDAGFETYRERLEVLRDHCTDIGRDPSSIRLTWFGRLAVGTTQAAAGELGRGQWTTKNAFVGTPGQVVEQMRPFVELGVDYFMLEVLGLPKSDVIRMVTKDVLPAVRSLK